MRSIFLIVLALATPIMLFADGPLAQCPEDPTDSGICDTLYVEVWEDDTLFLGESGLVRVPIRVTHDVPDPYVDSIAGFVIPLCYTHTNPSKYCSLSSFWNTTPMMVPDFLYRCIFRHLPDMFHPEERNRMMDMNATPQGAWDFISLDLGDGVSGFRLALVPIGSKDQEWWEGNRVLLSTMTFRVQDSVTVCVDSSFWPPSDRLAFANSVAQTYTPRHNLPYCFSVTYPGRGDGNGDGQINIEDVIFLLNYLFKEGPAPAYTHMGDANFDEIIDLGDIVYLLSFIFRGGPPPR